MTFTSSKSTSHSPCPPHDTDDTPPMRVRAFKQYKLHVEPVGGVPVLQIDGVTWTMSGSEMVSQVITERKKTRLQIFEPKTMRDLRTLHVGGSRLTK